MHTTVVPDYYVEPKQPTAAELSALRTQEVVEKFNSGVLNTGEPRTHIKESTWREIEILWESGEVTLRQLSERYGRPSDTFAAHFKKLGIKKGSRAEELRKIVKKHVEEDAHNEAAVLSERIRKTKDEHYKMAEAIAKLTFNELMKVRREDKRFRDCQNDIKTLLLAAEALKRTREERWITLGLDKDAVDEDSLPDLVLRRMTDEDVAQMRAQQQEDDEEFGIDDKLMEQNL